MHNDKHLVMQSESVCMMCVNLGTQLNKINRKHTHINANACMLACVRERGRETKREGRVQGSMALVPNINGLIVH